MLQLIIKTPRLTATAKDLNKISLLAKAFSTERTWTRVPQRAWLRSSLMRKQNHSINSNKVRTNNNNSSYDSF